MQHAPQRPHTMPISGIFLISISVFIYIKLHLSVPGLGVPYFFAHVTAILYLAKKGRLLKVGQHLYLATGVLLLQYLFTSEDWLSPSKSDFQYTAYWALNFFTIFGLLAIMQSCGDSALNRFARIFIYLMILVGVAEVYLGAKPLVDSVRSIYTSSSSLYVAEERDIRQYGVIRPNVFTSEPSSVGNYFGFLWMILLMTARLNRKSLTEAALLMAAAIYLFRTPTLVGYAAAIIVLWMASTGGKIKRHAGALGALCFTLLMVLAPYLMFSWRDTSQSELLSEFVGSGSFFLRQVAPLNTFFSMLSESPALGYGYQFQEMSRNVNIEILQLDYGGYYTASRLSEMLAGQFSTNAFWEFLTTNGLLGSLALILIYGRIFHSFGVRRHLILLFLSAGILTLHAGLILPFTWTAVIALAYHLSRKSPWSKDTAVGG